MVSTRRTQVGRSLAVLLAVICVVLGFGSVPAKAATLDGMLDFAGFHVGAFHSSDGKLVYCLEPAANAPFSDQHTPTIVSSLPGYSISVNDNWGWSGQVTTPAASGETLRQMNWVLAEHAPGASAEKAVAVQVALWELRRAPGNAAWIDGKYELMRAHGGAGYVSSGIALAAQARTNAVGPGHAAPTSGLQLLAGEAHGTGSVEYPAGTTSLSIEGGTFANGSTSLTVQGDSAGRAEWSASLHDPEWTRFTEVSVTGTWGLAERYWPAQLVLHPPSVETEQRLGAGVASVTGTQRGEFATVTHTTDSQFLPELVTAVPGVVVDRSTGIFSDTITVSAPTDGAPWPQRGGAFLPLEAHGVLYGPYNVPQAERDTVPAGAPVAAQSTISVDRGPGEYATSESVQPLESGYYYWVWRISEEEQSEQVRASELLPAGGVFADGFGVRAEGQLVPTELRWVTELKERELDPSRLVLEDRIKVSLHGGAWLFDEAGKRIPATIRFTVYQSEEQPVRQATPPTDARIVGTVFADVSEADTWVDAPRIDLPDDTTGWVTVRACLIAEDQEESVRGYVQEWCDDFGVPEETAQIITPVEPVEPVEPPEEPKLAETGASSASMLPLLGMGGLGSGALLLAAVWLLKGAKQRTSRPAPEAKR